MIAKERLEELIEQGATIYRTYADVSVQEVKLNKNYMKVDNAFLWQKMTGAFKGCGTPLEQLFETREDAEWHREFGCIERTQRLVLPTWEEFISNTNGVEFNRINGDKIRFHKLSGDKVFTMYDKNGKIHFEREWFLTKENYTLACRKCVELFKGEKK